MFFSACLYVSVLILSSAIEMTLQESFPGSKDENIHKRVRRIVNGTEIEPNSRPYLVHLDINGFMCGGTILDEYTILTAAHCFDDYPENAYVLAGAHSIIMAENEDGDVQTIYFSAENINVHENYDCDNNDNDIAILNLQMPLNLTSRTVQCLTFNINASCPAVGDSCSVAGWGYTERGGNASDVPLEVDLKVVENYTCNLEFNQSTTILAGGEEGKDSCQGDSGGPFACVCDGEVKIAGIVSWGDGCGQPNCPGVYTRVSSYIDWINEKRTRTVPSGGTNGDPGNYGRTSGSGNFLQGSIQRSTVITIVIFVFRLCKEIY